MTAVSQDAAWEAAPGQRVPGQVAPAGFPSALRRVLGHQSAPAAALVLLGPVVYHQALTPGWVIADRDYLLYFLPYRSYLAEAWHQGRWLPLWNPHIFLGSPFLANIQAAALYPPNLLLAFIPPVTAIAWLVSLHTGLAGAGMYLYALHGLRLGRAGSLVTALLYMFGALMVSDVGHLNQSNTLAWTPWLMLATDRAALAPRPARLAAVAVVAALVIAAGHTQQAYFSFLLAAITGGARLWDLGVKRRLWGRASRTALVLVASVALGAGIMALQLAPTVELMAHSVRSGGLSMADAGAGALPLSGFVGDLLPNYTSEHRAEFAASVGAAALPLIALALAVRGLRPGVGLWAVLGLVSLAVAFGPRGRVYDLAYAALPGFNLFRVPARVLLVTNVAAAILAGNGVKTARQLALAWRRGRLRARVVRAAAAAATLAALPFLAELAAFEAGTPQRGVFRVFQPIQQESLLLMGGFEAVTVGIALTAVGWRRAALGLLPIAVLADLVLLASHTYAMNPLPQQLLQASSVTAPLLPHDSNGRYLALVPGDATAPPTSPLAAGLTSEQRARYAGFLRQIESRTPDTSMTDGTLDADGYDGGLLPLRSYVQFRTALIPESSGNAPDFMDRLLTQSVHDPGWLGRAAVVGLLAPAGVDPNPAGTRALVTYGQAGSYVAWRPANGSVARAHMEDGKKAAVVSDTGERVVVRLPQGASGRLILDDTYYPGWVASVDGAPARVVVYDSYVRAVSVPPGAHEVVFEYRPGWLVPGATVSAVALAVALSLALTPLVTRYTAPGRRCPWTRSVLPASRRSCL